LGCAKAGQPTAVVTHKCVAACRQTFRPCCPGAYSCGDLFLFEFCFCCCTTPLARLVIMESALCLHTHAAPASNAIQSVKNAFKPFLFQSWKTITADPFPQKTLDCPVQNGLCTKCTTGVGHTSIVMYALFRFAPKGVCIPACVSHCFQKIYITSSLLTTLFDVISQTPPLVFCFSMHASHFFLLKKYHGAGWFAAKPGGSGWASEVVPVRRLQGVHSMLLRHSGDLTQQVGKVQEVGCGWPLGTCVNC
jgi:hypothetical protein